MILWRIPTVFFFGEIGDKWRAFRNCNFRPSGTDTGEERHPISFDPSTTGLIFLFFKKRLGLWCIRRHPRHPTFPRVPLFLLILKAIRYRTILYCTNTGAFLVYQIIVQGMIQRFPVQGSFLYPKGCRQEAPKLMLYIHKHPSSPLPPCRNLRDCTAQQFRCRK